MATTQIGTGEIRGYHISDDAGIARAKMAQRTLATLGIPFTDLRVWDALATVLPGTPANDDLGLVTGATFGTNCPYVGTGDVKASNTTRRAALFVPVPHDFESGATLLLSVWAGMLTTISDTTATIDVECYRVDKDGTLGAADLVTTSATTINVITPTEKQFTIDTATLSAGDLLHIRITVAINDAATATAVIGQIAAIDLRADLR